MLDFNTEPYNDDYNEDKGFHKILFRPSYAVQARELTQLQTILQQQIKRHGDAIFKQGAMVIPGQIAINSESTDTGGIDYVKVQSTYGGNSISSFVSSLEGTVLVGSSGVKAEVIKVVLAENTDPITLYVRYTTTGTDGSTKTFSNSEVLTTDDDNAYQVETSATSAVGIGSSASIQRGIYYVNGYFVLAQEQMIILDKYSNTPTYRVGLTIDEQTITPEEDETLLDNAQNSYNYAAPGAHRHYIGLTLTALSVDDEQDTDFIELARVVNGKILKEVKTTEYSELEKTLARRTYDESGSYTVKDFPIDVREHRNNARGEWAASRTYLVGDVVISGTSTYVAKNSGTSGSIQPVHLSGLTYDGSGNTGIEWEYTETPFYNRGIYDALDETNPGDESKIAVGVEPGKAYVEGYEIEKVATEYISISKAREYTSVDNAIIPATVGNYVLVTNLNNLPPVDSFSSIDLYDRITASAGRGTAVGTKVGTAKVRGIEWHNGTIGSTDAVYKLFLFDIVVNSNVDFNRDVKSFYYNAVGGAAVDFSADIQPVLTQLIGSVSNSSTTLTGVGTSFQTDLSAGDYISIDNQLVRVSSISSQQSLTLTAAPGSAVTGVPLSLVTTVVEEPENSSLIFPFPYYAIKSVRSTLGTNDTSYSVMEKFTGTTNSSGVLSISTGSGTMASAAETDNYLCVDNTTGSVVLPSNISPSGNTALITFGLSYASKSFTVIAAVNKSGSSSTEKTKTLTQQTIEFSTLADATQAVLLLGKADIFRIISIKMDSGTFDTPAGSYDIDIRERYQPDNGQRDTHYDIGRLYLRNDYAAPTAPVEVVFEYFEHSTGDYFTVNSYSSDLYKNIPSFGSTPLRDSIDFRPRIDDAGLTFTGTGSSSSLVPKRGIDVRADFSYYLGRKDKVMIDSRGVTFNVSGVSSLLPNAPQDPVQGMLLATLTLEPFTYFVDSIGVKVDKAENKRYTMRDIGKLENRINTLEYYTSMSLLEQQTESLSIKDSDGLDRFKNGFIVDSFKDHSVGDQGSSDYLCSIDTDNGILRPYFSMQNIDIIEKNTNDAQRNASNYKLYGDVITLPVVANQVLVKQTYASRLENVNPFAVFTFIGVANTSPSSDDWFETERLPDVYNTVDNTRSVSTGTSWNSWQTEWTGVERAVQTTTTTWGTWWGDNPTGVTTTVTTAAGSTTTTANRDYSTTFAGMGHEAASWAAAGTGMGRTTTDILYAKDVGQVRTGMKTTSSTVSSTSTDDRIVSTAVIPYIRSRNILVQAKKLRPESNFYAYFDSVDINKYCVAADRITYTAVSGTFDATTNAGGNAEESARVIAGDTQRCLNKGDVVYVSKRGSTTYTKSTSPATAVVIGIEYDVDTSTRVLEVTNINGNFTASDTITGTISGATGTVSTISPTNAEFVERTYNNILGRASDVGGYDWWLNILNNSTATSGTGRLWIINHFLNSEEFTKTNGASLAGKSSGLKTNIAGELNFLFWIPDTNAQRFRTGTRELKLLDIDTYNGVYTSRGVTNYSATGILNKWQKTITTTRSTKVVQTAVSQKKTVTETRVFHQDTGWWDPLAQTFLVESSGGAFLSKVDLFFATKDSKIPVTVEIRDVVNGYPGNNVLPFSQVVLNPSQVNLSSNTVSYYDEKLQDTIVVPKYDTATTFEFPSPVYVENGKEYAIVVMSDSNNYRLWISQMGDTIPGSSRTISEQPYSGVLFKSQNASAWSASQDQDLKFTIYRAQFDTNAVATVQFVNDALPYQNLEFDPIETKSGTNVVRIWHRNHGMPSGSKVVIANTDITKMIGAPGTGTITTTTSSTSVTGVGTYFTTELGVGSVLLNASGTTPIGVVESIASNTSLTLVDNAAAALTGEGYNHASSINGIPVTEMYTLHTISNVDADCYTITVTTNATSSGYVGKDQIKATRNIQYDLIQPSVETQVFPETLCEWSIKTTSGKSVDGSQTPYVIDSSFTGVLPNNNNLMYNTKMIASSINESTSLSGDKSFTLNCTMSTDNDAISPIIDTHRLSIIAVANKLNQPTPSNTNVVELDVSTVFTGSTGDYSFAGSTITSSVSAVRALMTTIGVGKYITISNATTAGNDGTYLVTSVVDDGSTATITLDGITFTSEDADTTTAVELRGLFVDEIAPSGSSTSSQYITKAVSLLTPSTYVRIRIAANVPDESNVLVYYRVAPVGSVNVLANTNWSLAAPDKSLIKVTNGNTKFFDVDYSIDSLAPFDALQVKLVMQSTNTSAVPQVKDLRIIACA